MSESVESFTASSLDGAPVTSQSVESFVAAALDDAPLTSFHWRVMSLISAGLFLDIMDLAVFGSVVPYMVHSNFATVGQISLIVSSLFGGLFIGALGQGEFTDRFGRKTVYQVNLLLFGLATIASAFAPNYWVFAIFRFIAGIGLGAEPPLSLSYAAEFSPKAVRGRMLAVTQFIGGAISWPLAILFVLVAAPSIGWRGIFIVIGVLALVVFILRFSLPESPRWLATHGQKDKALAILSDMGLPGPAPGQELVIDAVSATRSDPIAVVFKTDLRRIIFVMIAFFSIYGVVFMLATWLPSMMATRGFTITKSLTFTFGMTLAFPVSSAFLMYALDRIGRKLTSVTALFAAGFVAILFWNSTSEIMLLITGFLMFFLIQTGANAMSLYTTEVFPTNARATGLGIGFAMARVSAALGGYAIVLVNIYGVQLTFEAMAGVLIIGAVAVMLIGRESKGLALNTIAPPTA